MNGNTPPSDNSGEIKVIIRTLAVLAFLCVSAVCVLSYFQLKIPPELNTLTAGLVGSLGAMLVKTAPTPSSTLTEPIPTKIEQPSGQPVPVAVETNKQEGQT